MTATKELWLTAAAAALLLVAGAPVVHAQTADGNPAACPCWSPEELTAAMVDNCSEVLAYSCDDRQCSVECTDPLFLGVLVVDGDWGYCDAYTDGGLISFELTPAQAEACRASIETLPIDPVEPPLG